MVAERIMGQTKLEATNTTDAIAGTSRMLGWSWLTNATGKRITKGYVRMHADGSFVSGTKFQIWQRASPISSSTLLLNLEIGGISGTAGAQFQVPAFTAINITQNQLYFVTLYHPSSQTGNYNYFGSGGSANGPTITANNIFKNGASSTSPPDDETFTGGRFAVDVEIDDAATSGTIGMVTETGTVFPVTRGRVIGLVAETGTVLPVHSGSAKVHEIGMVVEFSAPGRLGPTPTPSTILNQIVKPNTVVNVVVPNTIIKV